jgi:hypothetical protein
LRVWSRCSFKHKGDDENGQRGQLYSSSTLVEEDEVSKPGKRANCKAGRWFGSVNDGNIYAVVLFSIAMKRK